MYKKEPMDQLTFGAFNTEGGVRLNPDDRWVRIAEIIPWDTIEDRYASLFSVNRGKVAKPLRVALGSLIIQRKYRFSDEELVKQIIENPYYQYFIGLRAFQNDPPFSPSVMRSFRKRFPEKFLREIESNIRGYFTEEAKN
jgi:IS5 family transposase